MSIRNGKAGVYPGVGHRAREIGSIIILSVLAFSFLGCAGRQRKVEQPLLYKSVYIELGRVTTTDFNGLVETKSLPWDATHRIEKGIFKTGTAAFKLQPLLGVSCWQGDSGLVGSPWAGLRLLHVWNAGIDCGFDQENLTLGMDWLYHATAIGPNFCFPYNLGKTRYGLKAAYLF